MVSALHSIAQKDAYDYNAIKLMYGVISTVRAVVCAVEATVDHYRDDGNVWLLGCSLGGLAACISGSPPLWRAN